MEKLPLRFFDTHTKGDLMSRYTNDVDVIGEMLNSTLVQLISGIITVIGTLCMMIYTNILLALITLVIVPLILSAGKFLVKKSRKYYVGQQEALSRLNRRAKSSLRRSIFRRIAKIVRSSFTRSYTLQK